MNGLAEMERKKKLIIDVHVLPNFWTGYIQSLVTSWIGRKSKTEENKLIKLRFWD